MWRYGWLTCCHSIEPVWPRIGPRGRGSWRLFGCSRERQPCQMPDGSVDRARVICTYCRHEMSTSSLKYHLKAHGRCREPTPRKKQTSPCLIPFRVIFFEPFIFMHDLKCWINIFIKQAYLPFLMLLKVFRTWKKYIKVHLEQKKKFPKNCD